MKNQYGHSFQMSKKQRELVKNYNPENVSELTAIRNRKPFRLINTMRKMETKHNIDPISEDEVTGVCLTLIVLIVFVWTLFNL
jgi:hypothetical protein